MKRGQLGAKSVFPGNAVFGHDVLYCWLRTKHEAGPVGAVGQLNHIAAAAGGLVPSRLAWP